MAQPWEVRAAWVELAAQPVLLAQISTYARAWGVRALVVDATGVGAGLASFLTRAFPEKVTAFVFTAQSKSKLGWDFISLIEAGRFHDHADDSPYRRIFDRQLEHCAYEIVPGPGRLMRWGVPAGRRDQRTGEHVHDDFLLSAALASVLDTLPWYAASGETVEVKAVDPLDALSEGF
jgi:hypothetical protein